MNSISGSIVIIFIIKLFKSQQKNIYNMIISIKQYSFMQERGTFTNLLEYLEAITKAKDLSILTDVKRHLIRCSTVD